ncbi:MAG: hypothetical protein O3B24_09340 [Verrucomicrobia bacterium]|nr:hypothetical protein [Verrucomicrobiota bacterium]
MRNPIAVESRAAGEPGCPQGSNGAKRSGNWRELIKKVWVADPLLRPKCQKEMRIVALIDDRAVWGCLGPPGGCLRAHLDACIPALLPFPH